MDSRALLHILEEPLHSIARFFLKIALPICDKALKAIKRAAIIAAAGKLNDPVDMVVRKGVARRLS
jgi:hypothetical protein